MSTQTIELVLFNLRDGADVAAFLATVPATDRFLENQPGFIGRQLARTDDGRWMDKVDWDSPQSAVAAAKAIMETPEARPFLGFIDMASTSMHHFNLQRG